MPAIQCPGCKAHLSVKGLIECPLCHSPVPAPHLQFKPTAPLPSPSSSSAKTIVGIGGVVIAVALVGLIVAGLASPSADKLRKQAIGKALVACQYAIQSTAQYGGADLPPYVPNNARTQDDEFYFAWPRGSFEFANGFGAREKMSASCMGTLSSGKITSLTVNGKDVI